VAARLFARVARKRRGDTPRLSQICRATKYDKLSDGRVRNCFASGMIGRAGAEGSRVT
jgi:hypothetical protein